MRPRGGLIVKTLVGALLLFVGYWIVWSIGTACVVTGLALVLSYE